MAGSISITLNGEVRRVPDGLSLEALLRHVGLDPARVAVERNRKIAHRDTWTEVRVGEGDDLEVVRLVGGG